MKFRPLILLFLLVIRPYWVFNQTNNKDQYSSLFNKSKQKPVRLLMPEKQRPRNEPEIYAVVIGVGSNAYFPLLKYASSDARAFASHLLSEKGGAVSRSHIKLLLDKDATFNNICDALDELTRKADYNDMVICYFSGHGTYDGFVTHNYNGLNNLLPHDLVLNSLEASDAKFKLAVVDACHSGGLQQGRYVQKGGNMAASSRLYQNYKVASGGVALLLSSDKTETSMEDQYLRQGVFTYYLLEAMEGWGDGDGDGVIGIKEAFLYVRRQVVNRTDGQQSPQLYGNYDEKLALGVRVDY